MSEVEGLTPEEQAWYDSLTEEEQMQMRNAYVDKLVSRDKLSSVTYAGFVKVCAQVAVRMHSQQSKKEVKAFKRLERMGRQ